MNSAQVVVPPATIGMLGGGQLGRYAVVAARLMGFRTIVLDPDPLAPAGVVADVHLVAPFDDEEATARLAAECAAVTTEFENAPAETLERLAAAGVLVAPDAAAVAACQDRRAEKRFLIGAGVPVGPVAFVDTEADLAAAATAVGFPAILKTARLGYDGKGQQTVHSADELPAAWARLGSVACVLEQRLALDVEISVVLARSRRGEVAVYPVAENHHVGGILDTSIVPARVADALADEARDLATRIADALGFVGVLAVEMFVVGGRLFVNELAPRPHNSGHWTLDAAATSQFEQQVRAVCGHALGPTTLTAGAAVMLNLLGDRWAGGEPPWHRLVADPAASLHLYGKQSARAGRKMGHVTVTAAGVAQAIESAARYSELLTTR